MAITVAPAPVPEPSRHAELDALWRRWFAADMAAELKARAS